jgi:hypothetical protein
MGNKRRLGFRSFQRIAARDCVTGITRVTFDHGRKNPTVRKIITALICSGANQLREELKSAFARPFTAAKVPGRPPTELDLTAFEEMDTIETAERKQRLTAIFLNSKNNGNGSANMKPSSRILETNVWLISM